MKDKIMIRSKLQLLSFFQIGQSSYIDPSTGYTVFTEEFLKKRRTCCGSGCRHVSPLFLINSYSALLLLLVFNLF